jgi:MFS family permease
LVPASAEGNTPARFDWKTLDVGGAFTVTASLVTLIYAFIGAEQLGWGSLRTIGTFALSATLMVSFLAIEKRIPFPLIPLSIFSRRTLTTANIVMLLIEGINAATILFLSLYLQQVKGYSPEATGFAFLPLALWMIVAANVAPRWVGRFGARPVLIGGTILTTLGPILFSRLTVESVYVSDILPVLLITGTGIAGAITAGFITATAGLPDEEQGLASGLIQTSQQVGAALGLAILVSVSTTFSAKAALAGASSAGAQVAGLHAAFLVGTLFSALGCLTAIFGVKPNQVKPKEIAHAVSAQPTIPDAVEPASTP